MNISRAERKKEKLRDHISSVAIALISKRGYSQTTMEEIAARADIAKGTLYNHFSCKEEILGFFIENKFKESFGERKKKIVSAQNTQERIIVLFTELLSGVNKNREIFEHYLIYQMQQLASLQGSSKSNLHKITALIVRSGIEDGSLSRELPEPMLVELLAFAFIEAVKMIFTYENPTLADIEKAAKIAAILFLKGASPCKVSEAN